jgi:hypothetical protein
MKIPDSKIVQVFSMDYNPLDSGHTAMVLLDDGSVWKIRRIDNGFYDCSWWYPISLRDGKNSEVIGK